MNKPTWTKTDKENLDWFTEKLVDLHDLTGKAVMIIAIPEFIPEELKGTNPVVVIGKKITKEGGQQILQKALESFNNGKVIEKQ